MAPQQVSTRAQNILRGAAWIYGSQLVTLVAQMAYASVTSRLADDRAFGLYAIALSVVGFANLIASGGFAQSVVRQTTLDQTRIRGLVASAILLGGCSSATLLVTAQAWAWLWGATGATGTVRVASISTAVMPLLALATGILRRLDKFSTIGLTTLGANILGMSLGAVCVIANPSPWALLVSPISSQVFSCIHLCIRSRPYFGMPRLTKYLREDLKYGSKIVGITLLAYCNGNILRILASRIIGPSYLGQLNRAEVLGVLPFQQLQSALQQAVSPEFRHDREGNARARRVWTDMMSFAAYIVAVVGGVSCAVLPPILLLLFGSQWRVAATLLPVMIATSCLQMMTVLLSTAIEVVGKFQILVWGQVLGGVGIGGAAVALVAYEDGTWVLLGAALSQLIMHLCYVATLCRQGYLNFKKLFLSYLTALTVAVAMYGAVVVLILSVRTSRPSLTVGVLSTVTAIAIVGWRLRRRLVVYRVLVDYGIIRRQQSMT